jgi:alcohol dehydrogenase YqhD (iron-dependent ADH family)
MITTFHLPLRLVFGPGSLEQLGDEAKQIGQKALIVTYPDIRRVGLLDRVVNMLKEKGVDALVFEEVQPNPRSSTVDKGAGIARDEKVDLVIGLGGGSAMDTAKGITVASAGGESVWHYITTREQVTGPVPSIIQVPTMAGTGSELNSVAVITNWETHEKSLLFSPHVWAKVAIVDPELTITVPKNQTASGGVDTFSHLVEYYLMPETPIPMNDAIREAVMGVVVKYLPQALARLDDIEARTQLSWASTIAMSQLATIGGTAGSMTCHGIEHAVSGYYDVAHGAGLAALLPAWMRHILPVRKERLDLLGKNVFGKTDGIRATEEWLEEVEMNLRLRDLGCDPELADEIADNTLRTFPGLQAHPRPLDKEAIAQIYRDSC